MSTNSGLARAFGLLGLILLRAVPAILVLGSFSGRALAQTPPVLVRGRFEQRHFASSEIFPGTVRDYFVYVPQEYDPHKPACLMVFFDGINFVREDGPFRLPHVFDDLIAKKQMPVTIAVAVNPGMVPATLPGAKPRNNRSFEYDSLGDANARFLMEELLPEAIAGLNVSTEPRERALCGNSSGAVAAFTVAWERPEAFGKVVCHIGSFTNIRGAHVYPKLIREAAVPKRLRVFLQDGRHDLDNLHGNWLLANQGMAAALREMGYDYTFVVSEGGHSNQDGGTRFAETLRWLWRDWIPNE